MSDIYSTQFARHDIDNSHFILKVMAKLLFNKSFSDVTFIIQGQHLPAHRIILANRCEYFRCMLYGGFSEANKDKIELKVNVNAFRVILQYTYTGKLDMSQYTDELMVDVLNLANEYGFDELLPALLPTLYKRFNLKNFAIIMNTAQLFNRELYYRVYLSHVDKHAALLIKQDGFKRLSRVVLAHIISRDSFPVYELDIFVAVMAWRTTHTEDDLKTILPFIRFNLLQIDELRRFVQPTGVLQPAELIEIVNEIKTLDTLPFRAGDTHRCQLKRQMLTCTSEYGYTWLNKTDEEFKDQVLFKLTSERMINHMHLKLSDDVCSYYVEVSRDCREWTRIADYTEHECYADQYLYFDLQAVLFIYIKLTNLEKESYRIDSLQTDYKFTSVPMLINGFVAPIYNVSRMMAGAQENWKYDSNATLTARSCDNLDTNTLSIFLYQPLHINCIYIMCDDHNSYVFQIETALRRNDFRRLRVKRDYLGKGFFFEPHLVSFIRISFGQRPQAGKNSRVMFFYHPGRSTMFSTGSSNDWSTRQDMTMDLSL